MKSKKSFSNFIVDNKTENVKFINSKFNFSQLVRAKIPNNNRIRTKNLLICEAKFDSKQNLYENNYQRIRTIKKKITLNHFFKKMQIDENSYEKY